jgi:hypothetical protein
MLQYPVLLPIQRILEKLKQVEGNKYRFYQTLKEFDAELYAAVNHITNLVRYCYQGAGVSFGKQLDEREQELFREVQKFERQFDLMGFFASAAERLITFGDDVSRIRFEQGVGLAEWQPLPMEALTAVESEDQISDASAQVFSPEIYVLNELTGDNLQKFPKEEILHISLNNRATPVRDLMGRYTFGVWSTSPLEPLSHKLLWKIVITLNDIVLRQRLVPREHHKLDLSAFDPNMFEGATLEERIRKAREAAEKFLEEYKTKVASPIKDVDKSYITGKDVEIEFVEPKHVTYIDPNPLIEQINSSIATVIAPYLNLPRVRGYAVGLILADATNLTAITIASIIKQKVLEVIRRHIRMKFGNKFTDEDLDKIDIRLQLAYGLQLTELVRRIAVLAATNLFTDDELRAMLGYLPLTEEQRQQIAERVGRGRIGQFAQTVEDIVRDIVKRKEPIEPPVTPESRSEKQET